MYTPNRAAKSEKARMSTRVVGACRAAEIREQEHVVFQASAVESLSVWFVAGAIASEDWGSAAAEARLVERAEPIWFHLYQCDN